MRPSRKASLAHIPSLQAGDGSHWSWLTPQGSYHDWEGAADSCSHFSPCSRQIKFQKYPVSFLRVSSPENAVFSRCSTRGCFNNTYFPTGKHMHVVCVGATQACQHLLVLGQFMTWEYDWTCNGLSILPHVIRWLSQRFPILPVSCWNSRVWEVKIYQN